MEKFLNMYFKIGKVLLMIALSIIALTTLVFALLSLASSIETIKIKNTPYQYVQSTEKLDKLLASANGTNTWNETNITEKDELEKLYKDKIEQALKNNGMSSYSVDRVLGYLLQVDPKDREDYVKNMEEHHRIFIKYTVDFIAKTNPNVSKNEIKKYVLANNDIPQLYFEQRYKKQVLEKEQNYNTAATKRNMQLWILLCCLYSFVIALTIPILIRIEENTRK